MGVVMEGGELDSSGVPGGFSNGRGSPIMLEGGTDVVTDAGRGGRAWSLLKARCSCMGCEGEGAGRDEVLFEMVGLTGSNVGDVAGEDDPGGARVCGGVSNPDGPTRLLAVL